MTGEAGRLVGLDYGRRRIGVAVTDPSRTLVSPRTVVRNSDDPTDPPGELLDLLRELEPARVIVGIPYEMDGATGEMAKETLAFAENLQERTEAAVEKWDERLTTMQAEELLRETGRKRRHGEKGRVDRAAAAVLLRSYLSAR